MRTLGKVPTSWVKRGTGGRGINSNSIGTACLGKTPAANKDPTRGNPNKAQETSPTRPHLEVNSKPNPIISNIRQSISLR